MKNNKQADILLNLEKKSIIIKKKHENKNSKKKETRNVREKT